MGNWTWFLAPVLVTAEEGSSLIAGFDEAIELVGSSVALIGTLVIVWGVLRSLWSFLKNEASTLTRGDVRGREELRRNLGYYLLLGLEFLVAADIVESIISPTLEHLAILGLIVVIRTVISYTLNWELSREEGKDSSAEETEGEAEV